MMVFPAAAMTMGVGVVPPAWTMVWWHEWVVTTAAAPADVPLVKGEP